MPRAPIQTGGGLHTLKKLLELNLRAEGDGSLGFGLRFCGQGGVSRSRGRSFSDRSGAGLRPRKGRRGRKRPPDDGEGQAVCWPMTSRRCGALEWRSSPRHGGRFLSGAISRTKSICPSLHFGQRVPSVDSDEGAALGSARAGSGAGDACASWP